MKKQIDNTCMWRYSIEPCYLFEFEGLPTMDCIIYTINCARESTATQMKNER